MPLTAASMPVRSETAFELSADTESPTVMSAVLLSFPICERMPIRYCDLTGGDRAPRLV